MDSSADIDQTGTKGFWNEQFWLPENVTWADLRSHDDVQYPQFHELGYTLLIGIAITFARILVEAFIFVPIGYFSGWIDSKKVILMYIIKTETIYFRLRFSNAFSHIYSSDSPDERSSKELPKLLGVSLTIL